MSAPLPAHLARGYAGEQAMGFFFGERGYFFIEGPSGAGGHAANGHGLDGAAYNPKTRSLILYDNKAWARLGNVSKANVVDPSVDLLKHVRGLIARVYAIKGIPDKENILKLLRNAEQALAKGASWPPEVEIAVSNASGRSRGVGGRLKKLGVKFIDYYAAPTGRAIKPGDLEFSRNAAAAKLEAVGSNAAAQGKLPTTALPARFPAARSRIFTGLRIVGSTLVGLAFAVLLAYFRGKVEEALLRQQFKKLEPSIDAEAAKLVLDGIGLVHTGQRAWIKITVHVTTGHRVAKNQTDFPVLEDHVEVGMVSAEHSSSVGIGQKMSFDTMEVTEAVTFSVPAFYSPEVVEFYAALIDELKWYYTTLNSAGLIPTRAEELIAEREQLLSMIVSYFTLDRKAVDAHFRSVHVL